ncbi:MAG: metal-dependent transcriptional regulator [Clostridia bacterium]|jgi:Mn-dependent DtxR family transcriptional regulator|nr:metal-dependent transcriptional regulator [Clostridia bacterium]
MLHLHESGEMYLESIYVLCKQKGAVRSVDVCEYMGYSKPSVSRAVGLLKKGGYLTVDKDGYLSLTEEGVRMAEKTYERHTVLSEAFELMGVPAQVAADDACRIEHHISDVTFEALKQYLKKVKEGR